MESNSSTPLEGARLGARESDFDRIADVTLRFEEEWTPKRVFSIEKALETPLARESSRRKLFIRLLEIDITRGFETNASIPLEEYVRRFPDRKQIVESVSNEISRDFKNDPTVRIGKQVDSYRILKLLGQGGTGYVYQAFDCLFERWVAIKFLKDASDRNEELLRLFRREIVAMGKLPHNSIFAHAYSCGRYDGVAYLSMEFVDGINLQRYFRNDDGLRENAGPLDWREATDYVAQIAQGLQTIHELGLAHRDVKPANVMLDSQGKIRVLDLGLADNYESQNNDESASKSPMIAGTRAFLAPEALQGLEALDAQADLYCLGGTYLYLLTGIVPSCWFDPYSKETPIPLRDFLREKNVDLPSKVVDVLARLLEPNRKKRYATAYDAWQDLNALIDPKSSSRKTFAVVVLTTALLVAFSGFLCFEAYFAFGIGDQRRMNAAIDLYKRGDLHNAYIKTEGVRPKKLSTEKQIDYWTLHARYCLANDDFAGAYDAAATVLEKFDQLPSSDRSPVLEFDARALEAQALVLLGETTYEADREKATSFFNEANEKIATFLEKHNDLDEDVQEATNATRASVFYWRARSYRALGRARNDVDFALADLSECLMLEPRFPDARVLSGDLLSIKARRASSPEYRRRWALDAANEYRAAVCFNATDDEKRAVLRKTILAFDAVDERKEALDVCILLLQFDSNSKFARRYRGKIGLFESLKSSPNQVKSAQKEAILSDLRAATSDDYLSDKTDEERGIIWMENALAELALGSVSKENCKRCVKDVTNALDANPSQSVYVFDGLEWNAFGLRRKAYEKLCDFSDSEDEKREWKSKIRKDAQAEYKSILEYWTRGWTSVVDKPIAENKEE